LIKLTLQRLFIIDGVISLPVAISGFFILPDVPEISNPWYLSEQVGAVIPSFDILGAY
jgi:hypothetical protein